MARGYGPLLYQCCGARPSTAPWCRVCWGRMPRVACSPVLNGTHGQASCPWHTRC